MRLRQIALVAADLDAVTGALENAVGLKVGYNDKGVAIYGLKNAVLPAGDGFLEVVQPVRDDGSAARFLARRGGDAGYMVILQCAAAAPPIARAAERGARIVERIDTPGYLAAHFHPADFGGVLVSFDEQRGVADFLETHGDWWPAGPDWRAARSDRVTGLEAATIAAADPAALARRWAELTGHGLDPADPLRLSLDRGEIRFEAAAAGAGTSLAGVTLRVAGPPGAQERLQIGGVRFDLVR